MDKIIYHTRRATAGILWVPLAICTMTTLGLLLLANSIYPETTDEQA